MAEYNLGTAHGKITIDSDTSGVDRAQASLGGLDRQARNTRQAIDDTATGFGLAGAAIAGGLGLAVKTTMDFEQGLSNVKAVSGATAEEMDKIHDKALKIGADTAFGATEATQAMEELVKAGISVDDVLNGAADATVALAAAGGVDMPAAATIASNAMNQFGLTAQDMVHTVDLIAGAANASAIDVGEFGFSMGQVGAVANLAGLNFEETAVAIAEMGNAGIKGSDAGTSLKSMLMNLQPTTKGAKNAMKELGLMTEDGTNKFYDQEGNLKSLAEIQGLLHDATKDLSEAQKTQALETIFGSDAIRAAAVLANEGAAGYTKMNEAMLATSAADVAKTRQDNLKGSIEQMKGAAETLAITIGEQLTPYIRGLADGLGALINWFNGLSPQTQGLITQFLVIAATTLLVTAGILKTVLMVKSFIGTLQALRIISSAAGPGLLTMVGQWVAATARMIAAGAMWVVNATAQIAVIVAQWLWMGVQATIHGAVVAAQWAAAAAKTVASWALMAAQAVINAARVGAAWLLTTGASVAMAIAQTAVAVATIVGGWIVMAATAMANAVIAAAAWFIALGPIGWAIAALIAVVAFVIIFWDDIKALFVKAGQKIAEMMQSLWQSVVSAWNSIIAFFRQIPGWVMGVFNGAVSWLLNAGMNIISGLYNGAKNIWNGFWAWASGFGRMIIGLFAGAGSWLASAGGDLIRGLWNGVSGMFNWVMGKIKGFAGQIMSGIKNFFGIGSPSKLMADEVGKWLPPGIAVGIDSNADEALKAAQALATNVAGTVSMSPDGSDAFWDGSSLGSGYVPRSREVDAYSASQGDAGRPALTYNFNTYNPVAERASDSEARRLRALSSLGAFGG